MESIGPTVLLKRHLESLSTRLPLIYRLLQVSTQSDHDSVHERVVHEERDAGALLGTELCSAASALNRPPEWRVRFHALHHWAGQLAGVLSRLAFDLGFHCFLQVTHVDVWSLRLSLFSFRLLLFLKTQHFLLEILDSCLVLSLASLLLLILLLHFQVALYLHNLKLPVHLHALEHLQVFSEHLLHIYAPFQKFILDTVFVNCIEKYRRNVVDKQRYVIRT